MLGFQVENYPKVNMNTKIIIKNTNLYFQRLNSNKKTNTRGVTEQIFKNLNAYILMHLISPSIPLAASIKLYNIPIISVQKNSD